MPDGKGAVGAGTYPSLAQDSNLAVGGLSGLRRRQGAAGDAPGRRDDERCPGRRRGELCPDPFRQPISAMPSAPTTSSSFDLRNDRYHGEMKMKHKMLALAALLLGSSAAQAEIVAISDSQLDVPDRPGGAGLGRCRHHLCERSGAACDQQGCRTESARRPMATPRPRPSGVLNKIKQILEGQGLGMADVIKMQVFLVHDARAPMDFKAFMEGYTQFFGGRSQICRRVPSSASPRWQIPDFWSRSKSSPRRTRNSLTQVELRGWMRCVGLPRSDFRRWPRRLVALCAAVLTSACLLDARSHRSGRSELQPAACFRHLQGTHRDQHGDGDRRYREGG